VENSLQVCYGHTLTPAVAAGFLSKSNSSPIQLNASLCIYVKRIKETVPVQNIPLYGDQHAFKEVEDCERDIITILCRAHNFAFSYVGGLLRYVPCPVQDSLAVVNEKNMS